MHQKIKFYSKLGNEKVSVVLIFAKFNGKWLLCRHKDRMTWEICGGHVENNEKLIEAAKRELYEESGAIAKEINLIGYYSLTSIKEKKYGAIYTANVETIDVLPNFEMKEVKMFNSFPEETTYPYVYKKLLKEIKKNYEYF